MNQVDLPGNDDAQTSLVSLATSVHESLEFEDLGTSYMTHISRLVRASAYGFYLVHPETGRPERVAVQGGVERFVNRWEQKGYAKDPLLSYMTHTLEPVHDAQLFSMSEWQRHPLRKTLTMRRLVRMLEAPLTWEGRPVGSLCFTRGPDEPPFSERDMGVMRFVSAHMRAAVGNALEFQRAKEGRALAEGTLQIVGAALVLSDERGSIKFANRHAESIMNYCSAAGHRSSELLDALNDNLAQIYEGGAQTALSVVALGHRSDRTGVSLLLRSVRVPTLEGTIATFLYEQLEHAPDFAHLASLLSPRELEVLELVAQGMTNKSIARRMFVSTNTVKYHMKRLFQTLQVNSRGELLAKAQALKGTTDTP